MWIERSQSTRGREANKDSLRNLWRNLCILPLPYGKFFRACATAFTNATLPANTVSIIDPPDKTPYKYRTPSDSGSNQKGPPEWPGTASASVTIGPVAPPLHLVMLFPVIPCCT